MTDELELLKEGISLMHELLDGPATTEDGTQENVQDWWYLWEAKATDFVNRAQKHNDTDTPSKA